MSWTHSTEEQIDLPVCDCGRDRKWGQTLCPHCKREAELTDGQRVDRAAQDKAAAERRAAEDAIALTALATAIPASAGTRLIGGKTVGEMVANWENTDMSCRTLAAMRCADGVVRFLADGQVQFARPVE